jgi:hypothetical protein
MALIIWASLKPIARRRLTSWVLSVPRVVVTLRANAANGEPSPWRAASMASGASPAPLAISVWADRQLEMARVIARIASGTARFIERRVGCAAESDNARQPRGRLAQTDAVN